MLLQVENDRYASLEATISPLRVMNMLRRRRDRKTLFRVFDVEEGRISVSVATAGGLLLTEVMEKIQSMSLKHIELLGWSDEDAADAFLTALKKYTIRVESFALNECNLPPMDLSTIGVEQFSCVQSELSPRNARIMCRTVSVNLKQLVLSYNPIGDEPVQAIADLIINGSLLQDLQLIRCEVSDFGAIALAKALPKNQYLKKLALSANHITDVGVDSLCMSLKTNSTLTGLEIGYNPFGREGFDSIGRILEHGSLSSLYLHGQIPSHLSIPKQLTILHAMQHSRKLRELNLAFNHLGDTGGELIASLLDSNRSIEVLFLTNCHIGDRGTVAIAKSLETNTALKQLGMSYNQFEDAGLMQVAQSLKVNQALERLDLGGVMCSRPTVAAMVRTLQTYNTALQDLHLLPSCCASLHDPFHDYLRVEFGILRSPTKLGKIWKEENCIRLPLYLEHASKHVDFGNDLVYHMLRNKPHCFTWGEEKT